MKRTGFVCFTLLASALLRGEDGVAWEKLEPYFEVPERFQGDDGGYPSINPDGKEWRSRRSELLEEWEGYLGKWPDLIADPTVEVLDSTDGGEVTIETVRFQWLPGQATEAFLLRPHGSGRRPAVLTVYYEPETSVGRGRENRDFALQLARRGFVTLSIGTTETTRNRTYSLYYPSIEQPILEPLSALGYAAANAWHVLASRPEVDPERIGIVGHSYGGKWALFAGCLFEKFAAVAVSDPGIMFDTHPSVNYWEPWYLGWHPRPWRKRGVITAENPARGLYPRLLEEGRDLHELHALLAPRPFFVSGGAVDPPQRWKALNHLVGLNRELGFENRVGMSNRPDHAPNPESNALIYAFFEHFLEVQRIE